MNERHSPGLNKRRLGRMLGPGVAGTYVDFETEVEELHIFGLAVVPGLLQTAEYARTMFRKYYQGRRDAADFMQRHVAVRMARQERIRDWRAPSRSCDSARSG